MARQTVATIHGPRHAVWAFFLLFLTGLCARGYGDYNQTRLHDPGTFTHVLDGTSAAPEQYRIGVIVAADFLSRHLPLTLSQTFAIFDMLASMLAIVLLFDLLEAGIIWHTATPTLRWFGAATFGALAVYALDWAGWYHRPTTLPTGGLIAALVWLWARPASLPPVLRAAAILLLALAQSFVRADIVAALFAGIFLATLVGKGRLALQRLPTLLLSLFGLLIALGVQIYLSRIRYPQASYGRVPVLMLLHDFRQWAMWMTLLLFIAPLVWTLRHAFRRGERQPVACSGAAPAVLLGAVLYLALWIVLGRLDEVRIFLPMSLATLPITVSLAMQQVSSETGIQTGSSAPESVQ